MDYQIKETVVKALIKLVESAPKLQPRQGVSQINDITPQEFWTWHNYIKSVFKISYDYTGLIDFLQEEVQIMQLASNSSASFIQRVYSINDVILNLSRKILQNQ